jgi:prepilin-type N-terminal cleavage/methylation domain-containing protein
MAKRNQGFTLIEVAILLVIIGLVATGGLTIIGTVTEAGRSTLTAERMAQVEHALQSYIEVNGCLPCPADGTLASAAANAGTSAGGGFYTTGCATAVCTISANAVVPWFTLGIAEEQAVDGWGNRLRYDVADAGVAPCGAEAWATNGMVRCTTSTFPDGGIIMTDNDGVFGNQTNAAYVLWSNGPDQSLARRMQTGVLTADVHGQGGGGGGQDENTDNGANETYSYGDLISISAVTHFDDIVKFVTAPVMIQKCGPGTCGNPS